MSALPEISPDAALNNLITSLKPTLVLFLSLEDEKKIKTAGEKSPLALAEELQEEMGNAFSLASINTDTNPELLKTVNPNGNGPVFILFRNGSLLLHMTGRIEKEHLRVNLSSCMEAFPSVLAPQKVEMSVLDDSHQKPFLLILFASWCLACSKTMPHIESLYRLFKEKVSFGLLDASEPDEIFESLQRLQISNLVSGLPSFVLFTNGKFCSLREGYAHHKELERWLKKSLSLETAPTKPFKQKCLDLARLFFE